MSESQLESRPEAAIPLDFIAGQIHLLGFFVHAAFDADDSGFDRRKLDGLSNLLKLMAAFEPEGRLRLGAAKANGT